MSISGTPQGHLCVSDTMSLIKSEQRVADHGEVFTPDRMVEAMLTPVKHEPGCMHSHSLAPMRQPRPHSYTHG